MPLIYTDATQTESGLMSAADKVKLDGFGGSNGISLVDTVHWASTPAIVGIENGGADPIYSLIANAPQAGAVDTSLPQGGMFRIDCRSGQAALQLIAYDVNFNAYKLATFGIDGVFDIASADDGKIRTANIEHLGGGLGFYGAYVTSQPVASRDLNSLFDALVSLGLISEP